MYTTVKRLLRTQVHILALLLNIASHLGLHENHMCQSAKLTCCTLSQQTLQNAQLPCSCCDEVSFDAVYLSAGKDSAWCTKQLRLCKVGAEAVTARYTSKQG